MLAPLVVVRVRTRAQGHLSTLHSNRRNPPDRYPAIRKITIRPRINWPGVVNTPWRRARVTDRAGRHARSPSLRVCIPRSPPLPLPLGALFLVVLGHAHTIRIAVLGLGARKARRDLVRGRVRVTVAIRLVR